MTTNKTSATSAAYKASRIMLGTNPDITVATKLYVRLKKCAAKNVNVKLHAAKVESIDTITLQLLLCFIRQVHDNGNSVTWKSPSESLINTARLTGLETELLLSESTG